MTSFLNISYRKVGGIRFWSIGRFGGSFHISNKADFARKQRRAAWTTVEAGFANVHNAANELSA